MTRQLMSYWQPGAVGCRLMSIVLLSGCSGCTGKLFLNECGTLLPWNFHVIEDGQAYRSSQPTGEQLEAMIECFGIRTVVNLRGSNPGELWYEEEAAAAASAGVTMVDIPLSKQSLPSADLLARINETLVSAEYPILIACQGGADRTGAVSAIYRILVLGHDKADAMRELSPTYLHFRFSAPCMDVLVEIYEPDPAWLDDYAAMKDDLSCVP